MHAVNCCSGCLGHSCVEQIGSDGCRWMNPEEKYQQRRHQRPATDTRNADQGADKKPGEGIEGIEAEKVGQIGDLEPCA
jgi:hypothetical protein